MGLKSHVGRQSRVGLQSHVGRQSRVGCQTHVPPEATASRSLRPTQRSQSPGHFGSSVFSVGLYYANTVLDSAETFCRLLIDFRDRRDIRRMVFALCPICTVRVCVAPTDTVSVLRGSLNIEFPVSLRCPELCWQYSVNILKLKVSHTFYCDFCRAKDYKQSEVSYIWVVIKWWYATQSLKITFANRIRNVGKKCLTMSIWTENTNTYIYIQYTYTVYLPKFVLGKKEPSRTNLFYSSCNNSKIKKQIGL